MKKRVVVLGSTGSIGTQTLDVIRNHPEQFEVLALAAGSNAELLYKQNVEFCPEFIGLGEKADRKAAQQIFGKDIPIGAEVCNDFAVLPQADIVVLGMSGFAALPPLLCALNAGKTVALANKESIVCGHVMVDAALKTPGARILPVDSEQSAIFQCLQQGKSSKQELAGIMLTASGGPFWRMSREELKKITPEQASYHPVWKMGRKITVDSATMFNKGLEIMEAAYLFGLQKNQISVLIHPQSIVHSMVEYIDGTVLAQLSVPDMRLAIQYALTYPKRIERVCSRLSLSESAALQFYSIDDLPFASLNLAYRALEEGRVLPVVYNGANEMAVELFLQGCIGFLDIERAVADAMEHIYQGENDCLEGIQEIDRQARNYVSKWAKSNK